MKLPILIGCVLTCLNIFTAHAGTPECDKRWREIVPNPELLDASWKPLVGLCETELRSKLMQAISTNIDLGYNNAKELMYSFVDNNNSVVCDIYTTSCKRASAGESPKSMNCEHSWPQSKGAEGIAKSDLHHLFPASTYANSLRASYPFCNVKESIESFGESRLGRGVQGESRCFEPMESSKGVIARALIYFAIRYNFPINDIQESYLRDWALRYPPNQMEAERDRRILQVQKNSNPFVHFPGLILLISNI